MTLAVTRDLAYLLRRPFGFAQDDGGIAQGDSGDDPG